MERLHFDKEIHIKLSDNEHRRVSSVLADARSLDVNQIRTAGGVTVELPVTDDSHQLASKITRVLGGF